MQSSYVNGLVGRRDPCQLSEKVCHGDIARRERREEPELGQLGRVEPVSKREPVRT